MLRIRKLAVQRHGWQRCICQVHRSSQAQQHVSGAAKRRQGPAAWVRLAEPQATLSHKTVNQAEGGSAGPHSHDVSIQRVHSVLPAGAVFTEALQSSLLDVSPLVPQAPVGLGCAWLGPGPTGAETPPSEGKSSCSGISLLPHDVICKRANQVSSSHWNRFAWVGSLQLITTALQAAELQCRPQQLQATARRLLSSALSSKLQTGRSCVCCGSSTNAAC